MPGGIVVSVHKILDIVARGEIPEVRTAHYSYNVRVLGRHTIFRYDNCHVHPGQPDAHHKDVFDFQSGDKVESVWVGERGWPTLGEVLDEARLWWSQNQELLEDPNAYPKHEDLLVDTRSPFGPI